MNSNEEINSDFSDISLEDSEFSDISQDEESDYDSDYDENQRNAEIDRQI